MRAILVDDSGADRFLLREIIGDVVEIVGEAKDGDEGFAMFQQLDPAVVISDIQMPYCDGVEMARKILALSPGTSFIFVSDHPGAHQSRVDELGAGPIVHKEEMITRLPTLLTEELEPGDPGTSHS